MGDQLKQVASFHDRPAAVSHLFFFGIQLEALVQGTAMLLQVLLLLIPHALCIFHHLFLDAAKQTADKHKQLQSGGLTFSALWSKLNNRE